MGVIIIIRISRLWNVFCPNDREGKWRHGCPTPERDGNKLLTRKERRRRGDAGGGVVLQLLSRWVWLLLQDGRCAARESVRRRQLNNSAILSFSLSFWPVCLPLCVYRRSRSAPSSKTCYPSIYRLHSGQAKPRDCCLHTLEQKAHPDDGGGHGNAWLHPLPWRDGNFCQKYIKLNFFFR